MVNYKFDDVEIAVDESHTVEILGGNKWVKVVRVQRKIQSKSDLLEYLEYANTPMAIGGLPDHNPEWLYELFSEGKISKGSRNGIACIQFVTDLGTVR